MTYDQLIKTGNFGNPLLRQTETVDSKLFPNMVETPYQKDRTDMGVHPTPMMQEQILTRLFGPRANWDARTTKAASTFFARPEVDIDKQRWDTLAMGMNALDGVNAVPAITKFMTSMGPQMAAQIARSNYENMMPKPPSARPIASGHTPQTMSSGGYTGRPAGTRMYTQSEKSKFMEPFRVRAANKSTQKLLPEHGSITNYEKLNTVNDITGMTPAHWNTDSPIQRQMLDTLYNMRRYLTPVGKAK